MLVGPQLGIPVGEADAHDVAVVQLCGFGHRSHDPRLDRREAATGCRYNLRMSVPPVAPPIHELRERFPRVAIVHEWLTIPGGSEDVVIELLKMFPRAELFTTIYDPAPWPELIKERAVHASFLTTSRGPDATTRSCCR